jgi:hypothetical protein
LIALLIFGAPWHLPPDWGDIPTWLAAFFAGIAGVVALRQLGILRQQMADEAAGNAKRDELIITQLAEAQRRADSAQRMQAEGVDVNWFVTGRGGAIAFVENKSRRPITRISCRLMSNESRHALKPPDEHGEMHRRTEDGLLPHFIRKPLPGGESSALRPGSVCDLLSAGSRPPLTA